MCQFSIPYNGDIELVNKILEGYSENVDSFYGNFGIDPFGGGRAQKSIFIDTFEELKEIISRLKEKQISFNYVINSTNMMNREFVPDYKKLFLGFIEKLLDLGINTVTLCNPYLIQETRQAFPDINISASVNFKVKSLEELNYITELGCSEATLHYDLLKNFKELRKIRENSNLLLKLIPHDVYINNCPWQKGHTRMQGAHSRQKDFTSPYFSYYRNKCVNIRNYYPEEILRASWFLPEEIDNYTNIGYSNFKLLDRLATTSWIVRVLELYSSKETPENIEEILGTYGGKSNISNFESLPCESNSIYPKDKLELIPNINIDKEYSEKLRAYWFSDKHNTINCNTCKHCNSIAIKELDFPKDKRDIAIKNNYVWQEQITKPEFINQLNDSFVQRIEYKS